MTDIDQRSVLIVLVEISGYTRPMLAGEEASAHSRLVISELVKTLLARVELPLTLAKLEGDALFLYAVKGPDWNEVRGRIGERLVTYFHAFGEKLGELSAASSCRCGACSNIESLRLKVILHAGQAVFHRIGSLVELAGVDVIIAHRLLKNSVSRKEYILITDAARDVALPLEALSRTRETYEDVGTIDTTVFLAPPSAGRAPRGNGQGVATDSGRGTEAEGPRHDHPAHDTAMPAAFVETLRCEIRREYAEVATNPHKGFHFHTGRPLARLLGYDEAWLEGIPSRTIDALAGTGNPFSLGELRPGERVVDLGSGAGLDSLIAARMVGPDGRVTGVDMTPEMVDTARTSAREIGAVNAEFLEGTIEMLPLPDASADVVISNGVINLAPDKRAVFREIHRVLKPFGRLQIGDIIVQKAVPESARRNIDLWAG
ncbi:MAG: DUF2652 domain-containing protein [Acidobacteria bacterium]|nr:DUF2652 domain-containing protein [Acidobacteriota bacterium]